MVIVYDINVRVVPVMKNRKNCYSGGPTGRNTALEIDVDGQIVKSQKMGMNNQAWANACFYVLNKKVFGSLNGNYSLEQLLTDYLADKGQLVTYKHYGFWAPVETYRDRVNMENLWNAGIAPWAE